MKSLTSSVYGIVFLLNGFILSQTVMDPKKGPIFNSLRATTLLYDQYIYTFGTRGSPSDPNGYHNFFCKYDLREDITTQELERRTNMIYVMFPLHVAPRLFTFGQTAKLPHIISMTEMNAAILLTGIPSDSKSFYEYRDETNTWGSENGLDFKGLSNRAGSTIVMTNNREKILLFGGFVIQPNNKSIISTQDLYSFDRTKLAWDVEPIKSSNHIINSSAYHSATLVDGRYMVILGGINLPEKSLAMKTDTKISILEDLPRNSLSNIVIYDIETNLWSIKKVSMGSDLFKFGHTATYVPSKKAIVVIGGVSKLNDKPESNSEVLLLSTETWTWESKSILDKQGNQQELGLAWHSTELVGDQLIIIHGLRNSTSDQPIVLDADTLTYTDNLIAAKPDPILTPVQDAIDYDYKKIIIVVIVSLNILAVFMGLLFWFYQRRKRKVEIELATPQFHLDHLWADYNGIVCPADKIPLILKPSQESEMDQVISWDSTSQYTFTNNIPASRLAYHNNARTLVPTDDHLNIKKDDERGHKDTNMYSSKFNTNNQSDETVNSTGSQFLTNGSITRFDTS